MKSSKRKLLKMKVKLLHLLYIRKFTFISLALQMPVNRHRNRNMQFIGFRDINITINIQLFPIFLSTLYCQH